MGLRIGVTSGIGSGKSTVCKLFHEDYNVPVYDMDKRAKALAHENKNLRIELTKCFGQETYIDDVYNSKHVADIIFNDKYRKKILEDIMGKYISKDYKEWVELMEKNNEKYVLVESAIFYETNSSQMVDMMLCVTCPLPLRIERVQKRNQFTYEQVMERVNNQLSEEHKVTRSHFTIINDGVEKLDPQIEKLNEIFYKIGYIMQETKNKYRNLIATAVAHGVGVGMSLERDSKPSIGWKKNEPGIEELTGKLSESVVGFLNRNWK